MKLALVLVLTASLAAVPARADTRSPAHATSARGDVAASVFFADHVQRMHRHHPGVKLQTIGYQYISSGVLITGIQTRLWPGPDTLPCWRLEHFSPSDNDPDGSTISASCRA